MPSFNSNTTVISELTPFFFFFCIFQEETLKSQGHASTSIVSVMRQNRHQQVQLCSGTGLSPGPRVQLIQALSIFGT